jgi:hypothetical protein
MTGTLFPNLSADEAEALRRLTGLDVAPELVWFWPKASLHCLSTKLIFVDFR